jgi:triosephosphate isomerase
MGKKIIVANWKMNPQTLKEAEGLFNEIKKTAINLKNVETVVCPPFIYISNLISHISYLKLGAQDLFWKDNGAYTGEISADMIKNLGVEYVIIGHSEKRKDHPEETSKIINKKIIKALENGLQVIFCIGEKERDTDENYLDFIKKEISEGLDKIDEKKMNNVIIAYEPIWAIGAKSQRADRPDDTLKIVDFIREVLSSIFGKNLSRKTPVLYGGSVDADNAQDFLKNGGVQGLLVGRSSLDGKIFSKILKDADV